MQLKQYNDKSLTQMQKEVDRLRGQFAEIMGAARFLAQPDFPFAGITMTQSADGNSIRISRDNVEVELLLTYTRMQTGGLTGRITAMLSKHPLESKPVQLGWFTINRDGQADFQVAESHDDVPHIGQYNLQLALTLIDRAMTHVPLPA